MAEHGYFATLNTLRSINQTVAEYDENRLAETLQMYLDSHNRIMMSLFDELMEKTILRDDIYGSSTSMVMNRTDEFGAPDVQRETVGILCGFPLHSYVGRLGWTRKAALTMTVADMTIQTLSLMAADKRRVVDEVKRALFIPTNYQFKGYIENRRTSYPIEVRRLLNADGLAVPPGPNGETYDGSTHTHYLATANFVQANLVSLLETVVEHYNTGDPMIYINRAQEATVRTFSNFVAYQEMGYSSKDSEATYPAKNLDTVRLYDRAIGRFNGAEVWVKPWVIANYVFAYIKGQRKPLRYRTRTASSGDLELVATQETHPLICETSEREFGIGVIERSNGAVLYTGGGAYVAPTIDNP